MYQSKYETEAGFYKEVGGAGEGGGGGVVEVGKREERAIVPDEEGPQVSYLLSPTPTADEYVLAEQMGLRRAFCWIPEAEFDEEQVRGLAEGCARHGMQLYNIGVREIAKNPDIILAKDEGKRTEGIARFCNMLRVLGRVGVGGDYGVGVTTFTWEPDQVWSTPSLPLPDRGKCMARACDATVLETLAPAHGRVFEEEELWRNLEYFLSKVLPVAKECNVHLALHPNDPPTAHAIAGVPPLMRSRAAFERAFSIAEELGYGEWLQMEFCCGCWLEGGEGFGDLYEDVREFARRGKIAIVHLRNVTSPLPKFVETYIDGGYGDLMQVLEILVQEEYNGTVILDHTPQFTPSAGPAAATAFAIGWMKAAIVGEERRKRRKEGERG